jgi:hypothetical protein
LGLEFPCSCVHPIATARLLPNAFGIAPLAPLMPYVTPLFSPSCVSTSPLFRRPLASYASPFSDRSPGSGQAQGKSGRQVGEAGCGGWNRDAGGDLFRGVGLSPSDVMDGHSDAAREIQGEGQGGVRGALFGAEIESQSAEEERIRREFEQLERPCLLVSTPPSESRVHGGNSCPSQGKPGSLASSDGVGSFYFGFPVEGDARDLFSDDAISKEFEKLQTNL